MTYTLNDVLNAFLTGVQDVLGNIAQAIADNAGVIGTFIVLGALTYAMARYGGRIVRAVTGWVGALV